MPTTTENEPDIVLATKIADNFIVDQFHKELAVLKELLQAQLAGRNDVVDNLIRSLKESHQLLIDSINVRFTDFQKVIDTKFSDSDLRYQQRFDAQQKALADALAAQEKATSTALLAAKEAVAAALAAADRAVTKAEIASDKRFESVNEFRAVLTSQSAMLSTKEELAIQARTINERLETAIQTLTDKIDGPTGVAVQFNSFRSADDARRGQAELNRRHEDSDKSHQGMSNQNIIGIIAMVIAALALIASFVIPRMSSPNFQQQPSYGTQNNGPISR